MASYKISSEGLIVDGILDTPEVEDFDEYGRALFESAEDTITLDLRAVSYISSACAGVLLSLRSEAEESGKTFKLVPSAEVKKVLDMIGFSELTGSD